MNLKDIYLKMQKRIKNRMVIEKKLSLLCLKYFKHELILQNLKEECILFIDFRIDCKNEKETDGILYAIIKDVVDLRLFLLEKSVNKFTLTDDSYLEYLVGLEFQRKHSKAFLGSTKITPIYSNHFNECFSDFQKTIIKEVINLNETNVLYFSENNEFKKFKKWKKRKQ